MAWRSLKKSDQFTEILIELTLVVLKYKEVVLWGRNLDDLTLPDFNGLMVVDSFPIGNSGVGLRIGRLVE